MESSVKNLLLLIKKAIRNRIWRALRDHLVHLLAPGLFSCTIFALDNILTELWAIYLNASLFLID